MSIKLRWISVILGFIVILMGISSCIPVYYAPNSQNVPLFKERKEANISGAVSYGMNSIGVDLQVAHAVTDHIGWMCNYNHWGARWNQKNEPGNLLYQSEGAHKGDIFELGIGYFTMLKNNRMVFETYGGYGWTSAKNEYGSAVKSEVRGNRYFVQPAIGWHFKSVTMGVSMRIVGLDYNSFSFSGPHSNKPNDSFKNLIDHPFSVFIEPGFVLRVGSEKVKFQLQLTFSLPINNPDMDYDLLSISTGLVIPIQSKKKTGNN